MYPRLLHLGPFLLPTYGAFVALALVAAFLVATRVAGRMGLAGDKVWNLCVLGTLAALFGSRLIYIAMHWPSFREQPAWILGVSVFRSPWSVYGGLGLAAVAGLVYLRAVRLPAWATLDALAPALALGEAIAHAGALVAGLDFGRPTSLPWGVTYRSRLASLWYGVPLGTPLHPTQAYLALAELALFALLAGRLPRVAGGAVPGSAALPGKATAQIRRLRGLGSQAGDLFAAWAFLDGLARFLVGLLEPAPASALVLHGAATVAECVAAAMVVAGGLLWLGRAPGPEPDSRT